MSVRYAVSANGHLAVDWVHQLTSIELSYSSIYVDVCCNCLELNEMFDFGSPVVPDSWHNIMEQKCQHNREYGQQPLTSKAI